MNDTINIIYKLNTDDHFTIKSKALVVNLLNKKHYYYTFWNVSNSDLKLLPQFYSLEGLDLLYLSLFVYGADKWLKREMFPDAWTRNIKLYVPVLSINKWKDQKELIEEMLSFLSGDIWEINFRKRSLNEIEQKFQRKLERNKDKKIDFENICMLSGGLDSFIGAIDLLESSDNIAFINHYGGGPSSKKFIERVQASLKKKYNNRNFKVFKFHAAPLKGKEDTTRTRSFMFFAHAIVIATALDKDIDLIIPENGLISINIPLTNSRLGSSSTRTTHPYYMRLLQNLIKNLGIKVNLKNPYQFKTKGEMILECKNKVFLEKHISDTMSCSHPDVGRYSQESTPKHCGTCFPCVIRRAAIKKANIQDSSVYRDINFSLGKKAKINLNTYRIAIKKYEKSKCNFLKIQMSGPLDKNLDKYKCLYERGMQELVDLLEEFND